MDNLDKKILKTSARLTRMWTKRYVENNDDLGYIKQAWITLEEHQHSGMYTGRFIPSWKSVEESVTDCYLDLIIKNSIMKPIKRRIMSAIQIHDIVTHYLKGQLINRDQPSLEYALKNSI